MCILWRWTLGSPCGPETLLRGAVLLTQAMILSTLSLSLLRFSKQIYWTLITLSNQSAQSGQWAPPGLRGHVYSGTWQHACQAGNAGASGRTLLIAASLFPSCPLRWCTRRPERQTHTRRSVSVRWWRESSLFVLFAFRLCLAGRRVSNRAVPGNPLRDGKFSPW